MMRVGLILVALVHVYAAVVLWRRARMARTTKYVVKKHTGASRKPDDALGRGHDPAFRGVAPAELLYRRG